MLSVRETEKNVGFHRFEDAEKGTIYEAHYKGGHLYQVTFYPAPGTHEEAQINPRHSSYEDAVHAIDYHSKTGAWPEVEFCSAVARFEEEVDRIEEEQGPK